MTAYTFDQIIDFTRTSAATYVANTGFVTQTPASRNLLTYTQEFDNAAWFKGNTQVIPNQNPAAATLGPELCVNGDFASATGWTASAGWVISGGQATATSTSSSLYGGQMTTVAGRVYRVDFDLVSYTSGDLTVTVGANYTGQVILTAPLTGRRTVYVVGGTSTTRGVEFYGGAVTATIDNVSVREVIGGALQAPDGTFTADTICQRATVGATNITQTGPTAVPGSFYTWSCYAKEGTIRYVQMTFSSSAFGGTQYANIDLRDGTVTQSAGSPAVVVTSAGNGWYRIAYTVVATAAAAATPFLFLTNSGTAVRVPSVTGSEANFVYVWGAQLEQASAATDYTRNFGGLFPPRFDYDPVTLAPRGLLIEEQRTNLVTYSEQFDNAAWTKINATVTANSATSPDGTVDAQKIEATATAATSIITPTATVAATAATFSVYVKQGTGATTANIFTLRNVTSATNFIRGTLNYSTGAFTYTTGSTGVTVTNVGNGWWRIVMTATSGITSGDTIRGYVGFDGGPQTAGDHLFAWGAQLEAGAFATSYIPTVASQVTRTADLATVTGANFASWYNQSEGSLVVEADSVVGNLAVVNSPSALTDGTANNFMRLYVFSGVRGASVTTGGVVQADMSAGGHTSNAIGKWAFAYKANDFALSVNGAAALTDTSGTVPTIDRLSIGGLNSGNQINGHLRRIRYYPTRLSNTQLQALTA